MERSTFFFIGNFFQRVKTFSDTGNPVPYFRGNLIDTRLAKFFFIRIFMCKKTENVDFGHEGVFWAKYDLGKSCRAYKNTLKNFFPNGKI